MHTASVKQRASGKRLRHGGPARGPAMAWRPPWGGAGRLKRAGTDVKSWLICVAASRNQHKTVKQFPPGKNKCKKLNSVTVNAVSFPSST